ncbi:hypothetical protein EGW08_002278 [Elysia chlorotica]|uniref:DDE Tnp4 domain-containing protein n=1 Tax=Elysia chlorotica TaxID=188477 RepID=A0A3S1A3T6_ELYCH|nr:hypothetical protein EGW08_002278 [Elysia chlorotica]
MIVNRGVFSSLLQELKLTDSKDFMEFFRISPQLFHILMDALRDDLTKCHTNYKKPIDPERKLMLTLRYLATGATFRTIHKTFGLGLSTARLAIYDVCSAIQKQLTPSELPNQTAESLRETSEHFYRRWKYPHCIGALARRSIRIKRISGGNITQPYNRNHDLLLQVQAVTDADGMFTFLEIGEYVDTYPFKASSLGQAIMNKEIPIPSEEPVLNATTLPYVFVSDETFPLVANVMRPYPKRNVTYCSTKRAYNHCHSQVRQVAERTFDKMTSRWGILEGTLVVNYNFAKLIVIACCILHNFVERRKTLDNYNDQTLEDITIPGDQATEHGEKKTPINTMGRPAVYALHVRDSIANLIENDLS